MVISNTKGIHNHINGLTINEYDADTDNYTYLCNQQTRTAALLIVDLVRQQKFSGKTFIFVGPSESGKTALAIAISKELGSKIPFVTISQSDLQSKEIKKSEIIEQAARNAIGVRVIDVKNVYDGEVVNIKDCYIDLRSLKGTKTWKLSVELQEQVKSQSIRIGDVVHIDASVGIIRKIGRSESHINDFDLEAERYVPLPKKDVGKRREVEYDSTLHELDYSNVHPTHQDTMSLVHQIVKNKKTELTDKLREEVNKTICDTKTTEVVFGILFIEDAHLLDEEACSYLLKITDSSTSPTIILSYRTEKDKMIRNDISNSSCLVSLLNRSLIVPLNKTEEEPILNLRLQKDFLKLEEDALQLIYEFCKIKGIKNTLQILSFLKNENGPMSKKNVKDVIEMFTTD